MRIIPKRTKVKVEFFKNVTIADVLIGLVLVAIIVLLLLSNFSFKVELILIVVVFGVSMFIKPGGTRVYHHIGAAFRFLAFRKKYEEGRPGQADIRSIVPFVAIGDSVIDYHEYCAGVIEIGPKEFRLLSEYRQNVLIDNVFASVVRAVAGSAKASLVKLDRPFRLDHYIEDEARKREELHKLVETGALSEDELRMREQVIDTRTSILSRLNNQDRVYRAYYYLVIYDSDKSALKEVQRFAVRTLTENGMDAHVLDDRELALFLKYSYTNEVNENDLDNMKVQDYAAWAMPHKVSFSLQKALIDDRPSYTYTVRDFPLTVLNAWGYQLFNMKDTKVVMNFSPVPKEMAIKRIDRSLDELMSQGRNKYRASDLIDQDTHVQTLMELLSYLQNDNETLFDVTLHVTVYDREQGQTTGPGAKENVRKRVRRVLSEQGFKLSDNFAKQVQGFLSSSVSALEALPEHTRSIHSSSIAAVFPFVLNALTDEHGVLLGQSNNFPVILDFFKRDKERVNSNMVIMGKSGSGKSFATKTLLANLAVENCKIYILDPENEYSELTKNLGGKMVDVGTAREGRLNPFHIVTSLDSDEQDIGATSNFSVHLQFLEEFFKQILPGIAPDPLEYLNNLVIRMYADRGITATSDLSLLTAEDYPTFGELYRLIQRERASAKDEYAIRNLNVLDNYINKFAGEGRNANLWDGASTLAAQENFTVFNFQTLLANKNNTVANAQMLLVLKWLDNEIIKNRDFNKKHGTNRKIIVVIDEAHVFIDPKYPIALDFMFQLAKRIRKYNGMQIIITQNIKDFVGSEEIARKSTAIINACQYSCIFALSPNDMGDLCTLYEKAGEINEVEQEEIVNNERGNAFLITGPLSRSNVEIVASDFVRKLFEVVI